MTLTRLRDLLSLTQIVIAVAAVALGGGVATVGLVAAAVATVIAFVRPLPPQTSLRSQRIWTAGIFVALILTIARAFLLAEFLDAGVDFLLLLCVQRLFNRQKAREHLQLLGIGSLLMVVGAVINTGLNYPALLTVYLLVAVMTLIVNHLLAEGERLGARVMMGVRREGTARRADLWRAATAVALLAGVGGLVTFLVFPRWGVGVFLRGQMASDIQSGFADEVRLGLFGRIKTDTSVVMRLQPTDPTGLPDRLTWHLRGTSFDTYEGGRWRHSRDAESIGMRVVMGYRVFAPGGEPLLKVGRVNRKRILEARPQRGFAAATETLQVTTTLEDIGADVVFAASEPLGIRLRPRGPVEQKARVDAGRGRELRISKPPGPIRYTFMSRIGVPTAQELEAVGSPRVPAALQGYLQLDPTLSDEFAALASSLSESAEPTRLGKVEAVLEHLGTFRYTLDLEPGARTEAGADPVEGFLFDTQAGHCEYFATAMAVVLRQMGVPTRVVNGYYGAHKNDIGGFYTVRQADAHSWVEVHFGRLGWVTFDPTPPAGRTAGDDAPMFPAVTEAVEALRNAYLNYVIDYNLQKQLSILSELGLRRSGRVPGAAWLRVLGVAIALFAMVFIARRLRGRRRRAPPLVRHYLGIRRALASRGLPANPGESAPRYAARVAAAAPELEPALTRFATAYETARFGADPSPAQRVAVAEAAHALLTAIKRHRDFRAARPSATRSA